MRHMPDWSKRANMQRFSKYQAADPPRVSPDHVSNMAAMTTRIGVSTVPAAWPQGVSQLARAIEACQRCDTAAVCTDWLTRAPASFDVPPVFCPNRAIFKTAKTGQ
jgi:hypothetical protein